MSGLPDQHHPENERRRTYTQDDVQHIVAREVAKQQLEQLNNGLVETNRKMNEMTANFNAKLELIFKMLEEAPNRVEACRSDLRDEIERDFPTKIEAIATERRIEAAIEAVDRKVEAQWLKITVTISVISAVITIAGVVMNYLVLIDKLNK